MTFETVVAECPQSRTNRKTLAGSEHYWFLDPTATLEHAMTTWGAQLFTLLHSG
jgi:hypothetical protein